MAKRETNAGRLKKRKPKQYKRETNLQRAAREMTHRETLRNANEVADIIRATRKEKAELVTQPGIPPLIPKGMNVSGFSPKRWKEAYAYLGYICCQSREDPPKFLRLVADILEGKPPYSPGNDWYDSKITKAYNDALNRILSGKDRDWSESDIKKACAEGYLFARDILIMRNLGDGTTFVMPLPTFSEFLEVFLEQNPESKLPRLPSERSLRRSLGRLGCFTRRDKRGRPKKK
jgi:hypothetical protein